MNDRLTDDLALLRTPAPDHLLTGILGATGLADRYVRRDTVVGPVYVAFNSRGVSAVDLADSPDAFERRYAARHGRPAVPAAEPPRSIAGRLDRALAEGRPGGLALDLTGVTAFQAEVLRKTAEIPPGETRPYAWIAAEIGRPGATRAVGTALARNPVPLVVPCHRVVRSDGRLGDYSLGDRANKGRLLESEGLDPSALEHQAARGVRYVGSATTNIFCHPTCRHAKRITPRHRREFPSAAAATRSGYRPCAQCRPAVAA